MKPFLIPDDFRALMKSVVAALGNSRGPHLDAEDAFESECGYGGRIEGGAFRFKYLTPNGHDRWDVQLEEAQIRDIADGLLIEVDAEPFEIVRTSRRAPVGEPLLIWGEFATDALHVRSEADLLAALDSLHASSIETPRLARLWTAADDQVVAALWGERCALYVVESADGYATSMGDATLNESFQVKDPDGQTLAVPLADCVSWEYARRALVRFVEHSDLGDIPTEGRIPSMLLMMGDFDRAAALAARSDVPRSLAASSLSSLSAAVDPPEPPAAAPTTDASIPAVVDDPADITAPVELDAHLDPADLIAWARRLLEQLRARSLVELVPPPAPDLDEISYHIGGLLSAHALEAEHSVDTATWLANEIGAVRGIARLFATGGDLQIAIRRSRERAPTME